MLGIWGFLRLSVRTSEMQRRDPLLLFSFCGIFCSSAHYSNVQGVGLSENLPRTLYEEDKLNPFFCVGVIILAFSEIYSMLSFSNPEAALSIYEGMSKMDCKIWSFGEFRWQIYSI